MTVRRNAFGRQVDSFEAAVRSTAFPAATFHAVFIRAPWVEAVGDGVEVLGRVSVRAAPPVGSSRSGRATCWPPRSTRS